MVRLATTDDIPSLLDLFDRFHAYAGADKGLPYDRESMADYVTIMLHVTTSAIFVIEEGGKIVGSICGLLHPWYGDMRVRMVMENWFWVDPGSNRARELEDAITCWAKENGASRLIMVSIASEREEAVKRYYRMRGYSYLESHFIKEI